MIFLLSYAVSITLAIGVFIVSYKYYKDKWR